MNEAPRMGMRPQADAKGQVNCRKIEVDASNTVPLGMGSPYYVVAGKLRGLPAAHASNASIAGSIVRLMTDANKSVGSVAASTDGYWAEVTFERNQEYLFVMDDASFAADGSDNGKYYDLTDETMVAPTDEFSAGFSLRQLEGASEATSGKQIVVSGKSGLPNNVGGVANTEVRGIINPANWQSW